MAITCFLLDSYGQDYRTTIEKHCNFKKKIRKFNSQGGKVVRKIDQRRKIHIEGNWIFFLDANLSHPDGDRPDKKHLLPSTGCRRGLGKLTQM